MPNQVLRYGMPKGSIINYSAEHLLLQAAFLKQQESDILEIPNISNDANKVLP